MTHLLRGFHRVWMLSAIKGCYEVVAPLEKGWPYDAHIAPGNQAVMER
jgi:hypothetical protein